MSEKVLLTGSSGFFGRAILEELKNKNFEVLTPLRPEFDLTDSKSVLNYFNKTKPAIVVHSAAYYGGLGICMQEPSNLFSINTGMLLNLLDAAATVGSVKRFMPIGSACAYPGKSDGLLKESEFWDGPLHPSVEAYGFTKKIQIVGVRSYSKQNNWICQFPQITNLYGEHDVFTEYRSHVAAALIKRFADAKMENKPEVVNWGSGSPVREFIYIKDAATAVVKMLGTDYQEVLNIGTGIGTSIKELAETVADVMNYKGNIVWDTTKPDGIMKKVLDVSLMHDVLQWKPEFSLRQGLEKTIDWYLKNKEEADSRN